MLFDLGRILHTGHSAIVGTVERKWQETDDVLGRFSDKRRAAIRLYREFTAAGIEQGQRPELVGGGLLRSFGGWKGVMELRRGREKYRADERVLGSSSFIEEILKEVEIQEEVKSKKVSLKTLISRIAKDMGISREAMTGSGRNREVTKARAVLAYTWVRYLGRSGHELAKEIGVTPQALYASSSRLEDNAIPSEDLTRWCT